MIRRRSLLVLTGDLAPTDDNRRLVSLLDELGRAGAIDPARIRVLAGGGGPLANEIAAAADLSAVRVVEHDEGVAARAAGWVHPSLRATGSLVDDLWGLARPGRRDAGRPDLVWIHGADAARLASTLPRAARRTPTAVCLPEGPVGLRRCRSIPDLRRVLARATVVVTTTDEQGDHLVDSLGVDRGRIVVSGEWRARPAASPDPRRSRRPDDVPDDALLVGGAGPIGWRAGTDLFLDLARRLPREIDGRPVHLLWLGTADRPGDDLRAHADVALRGQRGRVHLLDGGDSRDALANGVDLMVVTGREPPFPAAAIHAAGQGRAVIGLAGSGIEAVVPPTDVTAAVVDPFDGLALSERVEVALRDPRARQLLGGSLRDHVRRHLRAEERIGALWADVARHLARA